MAYSLPFAVITTIYACLIITGCYGVPFDADAVSSVIQTSVECHSNPAVAVGVLKDGKVGYIYLFLILYIIKFLIKEFNALWDGKTILADIDAIR